MRSKNILEMTYARNFTGTLAMYIVSANYRPNQTTPIHKLHGMRDFTRLQTSSLGHSGNDQTLRSNKVLRLPRMTLLRGTQGGFVMTMFTIRSSWDDSLAAMEAPASMK